VSRLPKGLVFSYDAVRGEVANKEAVIKALIRLVEKGVIKKLSRGKYYKLEVTAYGSVLPKCSWT
jgi:predicted transcriptional regulator of viral defense system